MSIISVYMSYTQFNVLGLIVPIVILGIPLYDTLLVIYFRIKTGKSPIRGSNDHFALRLNYFGFTINETVNLIYLICLLLSVAAVLILKSEFYNALAVYVILLLAGLIFAIMLNKIRPEARDERG